MKKIQTNWGVLKIFLSWVLAPGFLEWLKSGQPIDYRKLSKNSAVHCVLNLINETPDRLLNITLKTYNFKDSFSWWIILPTNKRQH